MMLHVSINSCARPSLLDRSIKSFNEYHNISQEPHFMLIEDFVEDEDRREAGAEYIYNNLDLFDEVYMLTEKAGVGFWWQKTIKLTLSDMHIHLEDDNEFVSHIDLDKVLNVLYNNEDIIEIIFSRTENIPKIHNPRQVVIDGLELTEVDSFSVAAGAFNTKLCRKLLDAVGWDNKIHEAGTLTPKAKELGYRKFVLGHNVKHYEHIGADEKYRKGKYE